MTNKQPTISITRRLEFDSGHRIPNHDGQCRHLHGHRYAIEVTLTGEIADHPGKVADQKHDVVAEVLQLPQLVDQDRMSQMQVGRGRIETGFDAQGPSAFQLLDEFRFDQQFIAAAFDGFELFGQCSHDEIRQIPGILQCEIPYLHAGEILLSLPGRARWRMKSIC